jgi:hypothetical protein
MTVSALGSRFVEALSAKDAQRLAEVLHPEVDFQGLTPKRAWEAHSPDEVVDVVLGHWFEPSRELDELLAAESDAFADREHLRYRLRGHTAEGQFVVEQQAYFSERDGRIGWMRVLCSGLRPMS